MLQHLSILQSTDVTNDDARSACTVESVYDASVANVDVEQEILISNEQSVGELLVLAHICWLQLLLRLVSRALPDGSHGMALHIFDDRRSTMRREVQARVLSRRYSTSVDPGTTSNMLSISCSTAGKHEQRLERLRHTLVIQAPISQSLSAHHLCLGSDVCAAISLVLHVLHGMHHDTPDTPKM